MPSPHEEAIIQVVQQHAETWNRHDMTAYAALFAKDADVITLSGDWWQGQVEIEQRMTVMHNTVYRESQLAHTGVWVKSPRPDIAIAHIRWELTGLLGSDGQKLPETLNTIMTWTLINEGDNWRIVAFQNTQITPPPPDILL